MSRLRYNFQTGTLGGALTNSGTTITFGAAPGFATLAGSDYIAITLEPNSAGQPQGNAEIIWLTAYTAGATTGTIARGQEGTTGVAHANAVVWAHDPTTLDFGGPAEVLMSEAKTLGGAAYAGTGDGTPLTIPITIDTLNTRIRVVAHAWFQLTTGTSTAIALTLTGPDGTARAIPLSSSTTWSTPTWEVPALAVIVEGGYNITLGVSGTAGATWNMHYQVLVYLIIPGA